MITSLDRGGISCNRLLALRTSQHPKFLEKPLVLEIQKTVRRLLDVHYFLLPRSFYLMVESKKKRNCNTNISGRWNDDLG
jgi:hypothetical protein